MAVTHGMYRKHSGLRNRGHEWPDNGVGLMRWPGAVDSKCSGLDHALSPAGRYSKLRSRLGHESLVSSILADKVMSCILCYYIRGNHLPPS